MCAGLQDAAADLPDGARGPQGRLGCRPSLRWPGQASGQNLLVHFPDVEADAEFRWVTLPLWAWLRPLSSSSPAGMLMAGNAGTDMAMVWIFPYFQEPRILECLPSLTMLDYQVRLKKPLRTPGDAWRPADLATCLLVSCRWSTTTILCTSGVRRPGNTPPSGSSPTFQPKTSSCPRRRATGSFRLAAAARPASHLRCLLPFAVFVLFVSGSSGS